MKKKKSRLAIQPKQKNTYRKIIVWGFSSLLAVIGVILFFNFWNPGNVGANQGETIQVDDQIFTTEMSLPEPEIKHTHAPSANAILVKPIKALPKASDSNYEK